MFRDAKKDLDCRSHNKLSGKDVKKLQKTIADRFDLSVRTHSSHQHCQHNAS